ncbi:HD-GYP domain-containing protein [Marinicrinis sediminis]|uniref:HD-GYP domain-containing protein n=1 Tax=Marinicrinis sediminis TaxID=1652465 RepID=A0ABW5RBG9_9BACL
MQVDVFDLREGDQLTSDVFNAHGVHILSKHAILNERDIAKLVQHQIDEVSIYPRSRSSHLSTSPATDDPSSSNKTTIERINAEILPHFDNAVNGMVHLFDQIRSGDAITEQQLEQLVDPLIQSIQKQRDSVSLLLLLNSENDYTYQHCIQVGMISYYIARWLKYEEAEAQLIGNCGFLHDVGKSRISDDILNKPGRLTGEECELVKQHTIFGWELIQKMKGDCPEATVALQHHERSDGSGYPKQLTEEQIHPYAKIVAVADTYSAMISKRAYKEERDMLDVLKELYALSFTNLDPTVIHTFIHHMLPNFIHKRVKLSDDSIGEIIMTNPKDFFRPVIRRDGAFLDLSEQKELEIKQIFM